MRIFCANLQLFRSRRRTSQSDPDGSDSNNNALSDRRGRFSVALDDCANMSLSTQEQQTARLEPSRRADFSHVSQTVAEGATVWDDITGPIARLARTVTGDVHGPICFLTGIVKGNVNGNVDLLVGTVEGNVNGNIDRLIGTVQGNVDGGINRLDGTVAGNVNGDIHQLVGNVGGNVNGRIIQLDGTVGGDVNGSIGRLAGTVLGNVTESIIQLDGNVGGNVNGSIHRLRGSVGGYVNGTVNRLDGAVGGGIFGHRDRRSGTTPDESVDARASLSGRNLLPSLGIRSMRAFEREGTQPDHPKSPRTPNNALMRAVSRWTSENDCVAAQWSHFNAELNARNFATLLHRLETTAEALNCGARTLLTKRIYDVLDELSRSPELRSTCFAIAEDALATCIDRVALGFEYIEDAIVNHKASRGELTQSELLRLGKQKFRQTVVERIARQKCTQGSDHVEVHLAYRTQLNKVLDLPGKSIHMLYPRAAHVSRRDLDDAIATVRRLEKGGELRAFLCEYEPWRAHLRRTHVDEFTQGLAPVVANMEELSVPPAGMSDGEYKKKCDELAKQHESIENRLVRDLTAKYLRRGPAGLHSGNRIEE
ncbi:NEL-type E3 ubiquitin ligase domain-containing protein [Burkholderia latens]|uniref:NEL-type E3 ubiquitin ligase domain-containing protein n=1 Tax=Burkholderia latens TaxID=488446 RepID=UPI00158B60C5|nr:NEL-type E3 ubiquitin ligase domain-containing protein [Burkholderia latens]